MASSRQDGSSATSGPANEVLAAIGIRLRSIRLQRGLTLRQLAEATKLSSSMLSLIERGRTAPSIHSLGAIARVLDVNMADLIVGRPPNEDKTVVRASESYVGSHPQDVISYILKDDPTRKTVFSIQEFEPGTSTPLETGVPGEFEYGYVLEGCLTTEVEQVVYQLFPGDLIAFRSDRPHQSWNKGKERVRALWIVLSA